LFVRDALLNRKLLRNLPLGSEHARKNMNYEKEYEFSVKSTKQSKISIGVSHSTHFLIVCPVLIYDIESYEIIINSERLLRKKLTI